MPYSFYGFGTTLYGACDFQPNGSYITTEWITALYIPLIPLNSQRVLRSGPTMYRMGSRSTQYRVLKKTRPHLGQVARIWGFALAFPLGLGALVAQEHVVRGLGLVLILAVCIAPFLLISRAKKKALDEGKRQPSRKAKTLDTAVVIYKECDLRLPFSLGNLPKGTEIQVKDIPAVNGVEWVEVTLPGGQMVYAIGATVRDHCARLSG